MSFALPWFSSGSVGEEQRRKGKAGGMSPAVFNELPGPAAGDKKGKGRRALCWDDGLGWEWILLSLGEREGGDPTVAHARGGFLGQILAAGQAGLVAETAGCGLL